MGTSLANSNFKVPRFGGVIGWRGSDKNVQQQWLGIVGKHAHCRRKRQK